MTTPHQSGLAIAASYLYPYEAELARALLESHEIPAWIFDEHQIRQRWWLAGALGGVKLGVFEADCERARQLLAEDHSDELQGIPESDLPPDPQEVCPSCSSGRVRLFDSHPRVSGRTALSLVASLFFSSPIPLRKVEEQWACDACGSRWTRDRSA
ncbi:MAG: DUF2007 domain-containing protein [Myxococcota bacterium]